MTGSTKNTTGRARLADIAKHVGVSTATVSRVLNGKEGVSDEVRQSVIAAMDMLGYERPVQLRVKSRGLMGLVVPELSNPIFPAFAQVLESLLAQRGFTPLLCTQAPGGTTEDDYIEMLLEHNVDGVIFVSGLHADTTADLDRYHRLAELGVPLGFINGTVDDVRGAFVSVDERSAIEAAVKHLVALGHERIGMACGPERFSASRHKLQGFHDATKSRGIADGARVVTTLYTVEGGASAAAELIEEGCTAIVCASDLMALGAIGHVRRLGKRVPHDVSVVGFDDSPLMGFVSPSLTTLRQPVTRMCQALVGALVDAISSGDLTRTEISFQAELVVRDSTDRSPVPVQ